MIAALRPKRLRMAKIDKHMAWAAPIHSWMHMHTRPDASCNLISNCVWMLTYALVLGCCEYVCVCVCFPRAYGGIWVTRSCICRSAPARNQSDRNRRQSRPQPNASRKPPQKRQGMVTRPRRPDLLSRSTWGSQAHARTCAGTARPRRHSAKHQY